MKKVILVSNGFQSDYEAGFANGVAVNDVDVLLASSDTTKYNCLNSRVFAINIRGNQNPNRIKLFKSINYVKYLFLLFLLLLKNYGTPVHLIGLFALNSHRLWRLETYFYKLFSKKFIMTVHNILPHNCNNPEVKIILKKVYQIPDLLVVHTERNASTLIKEFSICPKKIRVMQHGIDYVPPISTHKILEARKNLRLNAEDKIVLFFGKVNPYKGVDLLLEASSKINWHSKILIAGRCGDLNYTNKITEMINSHPYNKSILWNNTYLTDLEVANYLIAADMLVMPYRHIDQSGVLFTALKYGLPIVAFDVGSIKDYLVSKSKVVEFCDLAKFSDAVLEINVDLKDRLKIQEAAQKYLWSETVKNLIDFY